MKTGMLWFNDTATPLLQEIQKAVEYYRQKYGQIPDLCLVHPSMLPEKPPELVQSHAGKVALRADRAILKDHLWIGENIT